MSRNPDEAPDGAARPQEPTASLVIGPAAEALLGHYRLLRVIGEGGMGVVYEAEQQYPRRLVALKLIRGAQTDEHQVRMFQREAQALARLKHPAIATIYETGCTEDGQHFFAMELVRGVPLSRSLRDRQGGPPPGREGLKEGLRLFVRIAEAVNYAHQRGVIHRDLKPSNIVVGPPAAASGTHAAVPEIKILDFGLARITDADVVASSTLSQAAVQGTLAYMSPEQARGNPDEIDLRSDVYSLGVILYELTTGKLPHDTSHRTLVDALRVICEEPPRPPRQALGAGAGGHHALDRDLETIILKALEKDPSRRYQSALALAEDVERYLANQPILARPPSASYQVRKLVARHKGAFTLVTALLVLLAGFAVAMTVERNRARAAEARAEAQAETAQRTAAFLVDLFGVSNPSEARGNTITAREILDRGARKIRDDLAPEPEVQARLMHTMGQVYDSLGLYEAARPLLFEALEKRKTILGPRHLEVAASEASLGDLYRKQGRFAEAEPLLRHVLEVREELLGPHQPEVAKALTNLAVLHENQGRYDHARPLFERAIAIYEKLGSDPKLMVATLQNLGILLAKQSRAAEAEALFRRVLEINEKALGADHPDVGTAYNNLAIVSKMQHRYAAAAPLYERALEIRRRALGPRHPSVGDTLNNVANLYLEQGELGRAEPLYAEALTLYQESVGVEHPSYGRTLDNLAQLHAKRRKYGEAEAAYRRALEIRRRALGTDHPEVASNLFNLGELEHDQKRYADAEGLYQQSLDIRQRVLAPDHLALADSLHALAVLRHETARSEQALPLFERSFLIRVRQLGPTHQDSLETREAYAAALRKVGRETEAEGLAARAVALRKP